MKKLLFLAIAVLVQFTAFADEPFWNTCGKKLQVKGGAGIEQFVEAILNTKPNEWDTDATYDKKNGYFHFYQEGAGSVEYCVSYWNRTDGKKLVIMSYSSNDFGKKKAPVSANWGYISTFALDAEGVSADEGIVCETGFRAYLYDANTKTLNPLQAPPFNNFAQPVKAHYFLQLPQKGKDIIVREKKSLEETVYHSLKWNGMTFDFKKEGTRPLSFYFVDPKANIRTGANGKVVHTLNGGGSWGVSIIKIENGWCLIDGTSLYEYEEGIAEELSGSDSGYWIHSSVIGATGVGSGVTLYASPSKKSAVVTKISEDVLFHPIELRGEWVKVRVEGNKKEGWIRADEICDNPLTNCC